MIKTFFLLFQATFLLSFSLNAQTKDSIATDKGFKFYQIENYTLSFDALQTKNTFADLKIDLNHIKKPFFQKYNSTSSLNDMYSDNNNGTFTYVKSSLYLENLYRGVKIDSYNPKGLSNNSTSIIFGVFGVVLDKLQN